MTELMPTYFISHGGGPWPYVPEMRQTFAQLESSLQKMVEDFPTKPKAILMISGHWEAKETRIMSAQKPPMVYDYYNFPPHTYEVTYPAPGAPQIAEQALDLLTQAGIQAQLDSVQGFDHGTFTPMEVMYPQADMPLFQISLLDSYDPAKHIELGRALAPLRAQGVMIIGSGLSYHNLRMFGPKAKEPSEAFDTWLFEALAKPTADRTHALINWEQAPYARICHAQEDHLVPLFVAIGAAENEMATRIYHEKGIRGGVTASSYRFG